MPERKTETLEMDELKMAIRRQPTHETYVALQPPDAVPYIVAPLDQSIEDIVAFVRHWIEPIREMRTDMLKRFEKSKSLKCRFKTGDVVYLLGRPFMLRVYPLSSSKRQKKSVRGRVNVKATLRAEISVIDLFVMKTGDYDQGRLAFLAFAKPVFARNATSLLSQCMQRVFPEEHVPETVNCRPMRDTWVKIDKERDIVWFSESLIPYPADCLVYAYLVEEIKSIRPEATEEERHELLTRGVPNWPQLKAILADQNSIFSL